MAQLEDISSPNRGSPRKNISPTMESDAAFHAIQSRPNDAESEDHTIKSDPTFMQNQISIQRSPSTTQIQVSALSRQLSIKSNGSQSPQIKSAIAGVLATNEEQEQRGRGREDSDSSIVDGVQGYHLNSLKRSDSIATNKSNQSNKSVRSVHAVGSYPLGSLRVHSPSPVRKNIDNHEFLKSGDVVIVGDMTPGSIFGIDTMCISIKSAGEFDGIRDIPSGAHFIWGGTTNLSARNGFWIMSAKRASDELGEIHVKHWNAYDEILEEQHIAAEARIQKQGLPEIFEKLKPYSLGGGQAMPKPQGVLGKSRLYAEDSNLWRHLTSCLKGVLLSRITGHAWNKWQVSSNHDRKAPAGASFRSEEDYRNDEVLSFVFPKSSRTFSENSVGRERTEQVLDTSAYIMSIVVGSCSYEDSDEIIGELQFCYITGMTLGNIACQEQWANIVKVLFRAYKLALDYPIFFRKAIEAVHAQLIYDESGYDSSILDHDAGLEDELKIIFTTFKSRLNEQLLAKGSHLTDDQNEVGKAFEELESWLWKWGWDLRGNYVRSGKLQLEDGEIVDAELKDFEAEDERGKPSPIPKERSNTDRIR